MKKPYLTSLFNAINAESERQQEHIELIASENFVSEDVLAVTGSILTNKYAEGYPGKRYYGGCEFVDQVENIAIEALKKLFNAEHVNVQPHSGSQANAAAYAAMIHPGDTILGMELSAGGHLTHGYRLNFSGQMYHAIAYGLDRQTELIDYEQVRKLALEYKPKLIIAGASAYSRFIDFKKFREICDEVGAYLLVDMAHIAGLIAAGLHPSPIPYADVVTSTTHKTLRGARGGIILCKAQYAKQIDSAVFPGTQGGPLMHSIAGKAIAFLEALQPEFIEYQKAVIENCKVLAEEFAKRQYHVISGGTDNHLLMLNIKSKHSTTGKIAEDLLYKIGITCNKNSIPFDTEKPFQTSGIRLGTAAMTTRGFRRKEFIEVADIIDISLSNINNENIQRECHNRVLALTKKFPYSEANKKYHV